MSSDLLVSFSGGGSFSEADAFQDGVFAEAFFQREDGFLHFSLLLERFFLLLFAASQLFVVCEEIKLHGQFLFLRVLIHQVSHGEVHAADEEVGIDEASEEFHHGVGDDFG